MLTRDQIAATQIDGHALLEACPGSGKTRCLISKVQRSLAEVENGPRRICCITYTNAAVTEIEARLRATGYSHLDENVEVSTIHSFCLNSVLRHYAQELPDLRGGFTVLPPDAEAYIDLVGAVAQRYGLTDRTAGKLQYARRDLDGGVLVPDGDLPPDAVLDLWRRLAEGQFLDFDAVVYSAYLILRRNPRAAAALSARYAWILVDEFQDTDRLQVELLRALAQAGHSKFFLVGDPHQSIYGFAGARPDLVPDFAREIGAARVAPLSENFRSSNAIVITANRLIARAPEMWAAGPNAVEEVAPAFLPNVEYGTLVVDHLLPRAEALGIAHGSIAVLAPQWFSLLPIGRQLRAAGISVMGPGARPYKGSHLLARLAEQLAAFVEERSPATIRRIERELFNLLAELTGRWQFGVYSFRGRRTCYELSEMAAGARRESDSAADWLVATADLLCEVMLREAWLSPEQAGRLPGSAAAMIADVERNGLDPSDLRVADLGLFAASSASIRLLTLHGSKGREFDAVAIVDVLEGKIPHFSARTEEEIAEGARLLYVGITRARRLLLLGAQSRDHRDRPSRFLGQDGLGLR